MKNAIKKMKWGILALGLLLGVGLALGLRADIKYFWLDHPTGRNNPNDPLSPLYASPTPKGPAGTATASPTISPTPTVTGTGTPLPTGTPTMTPTDSPTALGTFTQTPTYTASPTVTMTFTPVPATGWPLVYGTDSSGSLTSTASFQDNGAGYAIATYSPGSGPAAGDTFYAAVSLSCPATIDSAVGEFTTGYTAGGAPNPQDSTSYNALSISVELTNNSVVPAVSLVTTAGDVTKTTMVVSLEPYILGGAQFMAEGTWYTAVVPLQVFYGLGTSVSAPANYSSNSPQAGELFSYYPGYPGEASPPDDGGVDGTGFNGQADPYGATITAADMASVFGVNVQPTTYTFTPATGSGTPPPAAGGLALTTYNVDDIVFVTTTASTLTSAVAPGQAAFGMTAMFCDFEHGAQSNWGDYWSSFTDGDYDATNDPNAGFAGICTGAGSVSTRVFPQCSDCPFTTAASPPSGDEVNPPVDGAEGSGDSGNAPTPSNFGHIAGTIGSEANGADCSNANPSGNYTFFGMGVYFLPSHNPANILQILQVGQATAGCTGCTAPAYGSNPRPIGIQLDIKAGPNDTNCPGNCEKYYLAISYAGNSDSNGPNAELIPTQTWQTVQIPFPTPGATGTTVAMSNNGGTAWAGGGTYEQNAFSMATWDNTPVTWDYSGTSTDTLENLEQLKVEADNRGVPVDMEVDNIQFYYAAGTFETPARRAAAVRRAAARR